MSDERFRSVFGRLDGGPMELDDEFDARLRERLIAALGLEETVEETVEATDASTQTVIDMRETWDREPRLGRWRRRVPVLAAAAAVVTVLAVVVVDRTGDDAETVPPAGGTTASPRESAAPEVVVPPVPAGWSHAPVPPDCDEPADQAIGPDGVLWVGNGNGLYRWDGEWTQFTHEDGLPAGPDFSTDPRGGGGPCGAASISPDVHEVEVAPDGTVWIANGAGVSSFDGEEFTVVAGHPGGVVPETFGGYFRVDGNGDVWFPLFERIENPVEDIDPETGEPFVDPETGEPAVFVTEPLTGLARLDGDTWTEFPLELPGDPLAARPFVADDGTAFMRGSESIHELVDGAWTRIDAELPGGDRLGRSTAAGPDGSLWVSVTDEQGVDPETGAERLTALAQWDGETWIMHTEEIPVAFWQPIVAPDGTFWAGMAPSDEEVFGGLVSYDGVNWTVHPKEGVDSDCAPVFLMSDGSSIWVGGPWCNPVRYNPNG